MAPRRKPPPLTRLTAQVLLATLAIFTSCNNDPSSDPPPTTQSPESEVETAYEAFWEMATRLAEAPDSGDPELATRASGDALEDLVVGLRTLEEQNRRSELGPKYEHEVLSVQLDDLDAAIVRDCAVDDSRIVDASGQVVVEGVGTQLLSVTVRRDGGRWLVDSIEQVESWSGAVPCE